MKCRQKSRNTRVDKHRRPLSKEFNDRLKEIVLHEASELYRGKYESPEELVERFANKELPNSLSRKFWKPIMQHFPNERSNTLILRVTNLFFNGKKGKWCEEEGKKLIDLVYIY